MSEKLTEEVVDECRETDTNKDVVVLYSTAVGYRVWRWKEFHAFIGRLGVPKDPRITRLTITVPVNDLVKVIMHFQGSDTTGPGVTVEHGLE